MATRAKLDAAAASADGSADASSKVLRDPVALIDARIAEFADWRGPALARLRALVHQAVPEVVETWKWRGVPVWEHHGIICTGETYRTVVKMTFAKGAALPDPHRLFNASLDGNVRRAIDWREGDEVNAAALIALVQAAAELNADKARPPRLRPRAATP